MRNGEEKKTEKKYRKNYKKHKSEYGHFCKLWMEISGAFDEYMKTLLCLYTYAN